MKICIAVFHHNIGYNPTIVVSNNRKVGDSFKFYFDFGRFTMSKIHYEWIVLYTFSILLVSRFYNMFTLEF